MKGITALAIATLTLYIAAPAGYAEMREFTGSNGRTMTAEIVSATGDNVTLRRADKRKVTTKVTVFSPEDQQYIKDWKAQAQATRIPRLDINVDSGKTTRDHGSYYDDTIQQFQFTVSISNTERDLDVESCKGTLLVFGKSVTSSNDLKLLDRQEFDVNIPIGRTLTFKGNPLKNTYDDVDYKSGHRYNGYLLVIQNKNGAIIGTKGAPDVFSKYAANAIKLQKGDACDRALMGSSSSEAGGGSTVIVR